MIETILKACIEASDNLTTDLYFEIPADKPARFYLLEKTGETITDHINRATITIQSFAPSLYEAAELNEIIKGIMLNELPDNVEISRVSLNSDYNYTDAATKQYRYQAVFVVTYYN